MSTDPFIVNEANWKEAISPVVFKTPKILTESAYIDHIPLAWVEHIPFAFWLMEASRPCVVVELGTHYGISYFSFCQAIQQSNLKSTCYAVDTWEGDEHAGFYDEKVFEFVKSINKQYDSFSTLYRATFDQAIHLFNDNSIDVLHIDGLHTYDAVKHDFESWLPKISERGIVIFHDTNVTEQGFGVYQLWEELIQKYPFFEFKHGYGLGVLGVGKKISKKLRILFSLSSIPTKYSSVKESYERLGALIKIENELLQLRAISAQKDDLGNSIPASTIYLQNTTFFERRLCPLQTINTQVFWKNGDEEFCEINSAKQTIDISNSESNFLFKFEQDFSGVKVLRIDPAAEQGIFYINYISIADISGKILLGWDEIKQLSFFTNLVVLKSSLIENAFVFISITDDPIIEIKLSEKPYFKENESIQLSIGFSKLDDESLKAELSNISASQIKPSCENETRRIYADVLLRLQTAIEESSAKQQKLEHEKNIFVTEIEQQRLMFERLIKEADERLRIKEEVFNSLSEKVDQLTSDETALKQEILQKYLDEKSLKSIFEKTKNEMGEVIKDLKNKELIIENHQNELNELERRRIEDANIALQKINECTKSLLEKNSIIESNQKDFAEKEAVLRTLQNNIDYFKMHYENNSILGIIKHRVKKHLTNNL
ncbi:MAG: family 2 glycosyl transferase [Ferruginibacter sp.]|uniref:class I SAM-dependent methyltransferase n=1 Tax=Ferruginibacter sp. TaxID=1940288 RepID=UPI0026587AD6|nr:class I SAM-dependent methyltransferase [Ferruginibacter sp.]MDB5278163.1 family 2 glycosyl transferase [Ferruginibacter sp.]